MQIALIVIAYTSLVSIAVYLIAYSRLYDWWKNSLGRVMNLSLISIALIAVGVIVANAGSPLGLVINSIGWVTFIILLIWRLVILLTFAKKRRTTVQNKPQ